MRKGWRLYPVVEAIQALRGMALAGTIIVIAELGTSRGSTRRAS